MKRRSFLAMLAAVFVPKAKAAPECCVPKGDIRNWSANGVNARYVSLADPIPPEIAFAIERLRRFRAAYPLVEFPKRRRHSFTSEEEDQLHARAVEIARARIGVGGYTR